MLGGLVDGARVGHAKNSRTEVGLGHSRHISKVLMLKCFLSSDTFGRVVGKKAVEKVNKLLWSVRKQFFEAYSFFLREVKLILAHMSGPAFEEVDEGLFGRSENLIDLMYLIKFSFSIEERVLGHHFEEDAAVPPDVHLGVVVAVSHEALGRTVPACGYVLRIWLLGVDACVALGLPLHEPKSASLMESPEMRTFSGLMSRWKMPFPWM